MELSIFFCLGKYPGWFNLIIQQLALAWNRVVGWC